MWQEEGSSGRQKVVCLPAALGTPLEAGVMQEEKAKAICTAQHTEKNNLRNAAAQRNVQCRYRDAAKGTYAPARTFKPQTPGAVGRCVCREQVGVGQCR